MFIFISTVNHEICENIKEVDTGGRLGTQINCILCKKNPQHPNFIPADEFQEENLNVWNTTNLPHNLTLNDCYELIKTMIPLTVRLESWYVSENRPSENYPLCGKRGQELKTGERNVGSGWILCIEEVKDDYMCDVCSATWNRQFYETLNDCPDGECSGR